jgi:hypothetical protein
MSTPWKIPSLRISTPSGWKIPSASISSPTNRIPKKKPPAFVKQSYACFINTSSRMMPRLSFVPDSFLKEKYFILSFILSTYSHKSTILPETESRHCLSEGFQPKQTSLTFRGELCPDGPPAPVRNDEGRIFSAACYVSKTARAPSTPRSRNSRIRTCPRHLTAGRLFSSPS